MDSNYQTIDDAVEEETKKLTPEQQFHENQKAEHKELDARYKSFESQEEAGENAMCTSGILSTIVGTVGLYNTLTTPTFFNCFLDLSLLGVFIYLFYLGGQKISSSQAGMEGVFRRKRILDEQLYNSPPKF